MDELPVLRTARVAPYIESIAKARKLGRTWAEIRLTLTHLEIADTAEKFRQTYQRARRRYERGNLVPEQIPLPQKNSDTHSKSERSGNEDKNKKLANEKQIDVGYENNNTNNFETKSSRKRAEEIGLFNYEDNY